MTNTNETKNKTLEERMIVPCSPLAVWPNHPSVFQGLTQGYVGHIGGYDGAGLPKWEPYKIGDSVKDIVEHHKQLSNAGIVDRLKRLKFVDIDQHGDLTPYLKKDEGLLFLLGDGSFPVGCGSSDLCTIMAVRPGVNSAYEISGKIYKDIGIKVNTRATGKLKLENEKLYVKEFTTSFFEKIEDYADVIRGLTYSEDLAKEGTPILFEPNFLGVKK